MLEEVTNISRCSRSLFPAYTSKRFFGFWCVVLALFFPVVRLPSPSLSVTEAIKNETPKEETYEKKKRKKERAEAISVVLASGNNHPPLLLLPYYRKQKKRSNQNP